MEKVRFAIIGTSMITEQFLQAASHCETFILAAVYSRNLDRAQQFAKKYNANLIFDDLDKLADCTEVDAVYIASPTAFHYRQSLMMLKSGKHVLCEKPITTNLHELETLLRIAEEKKVVFLEAMRNVFTPGYNMIRENMEKIGPIRRATFVYCQYSSRYDKFKQGKIENAFRPELSNGAIMDIGVYGIHMLASLFGIPYSLSAKGRIISGSIDVSGVIIGKYKDMQAEVIYSKITDSYMPSEIQGERGNIVFLTLSSPKKIKVIMRDGSKEVYKVDSVEPDMYYEIQAFLDMITGNRTDTQKWNTYSYETMQIMDDARKQMDIVFPNDF